VSTLVSIVTPSYNQAAFLEAAMLSVLNQPSSFRAGHSEAQDEPFWLEYMVVDGGSTDGSLEIIQKHAHQLAWWVSERDSGQAEAINKGLLRAQGEIVAWLNSDDLYLPGAIQKAVNALHADPSLGLVYGNALTINPAGQALNDLVFGDWGINDLLRFRIICQPAVFMRREVLERACGSDLLQTNLHFMLDHHLWLRIGRLAPIRHLDCFLAAARHHPSAKNVSQAPGFGRESLQLLEWLLNDPGFALLIRGQERQIKGGAYRLNARYLLDGGQPGSALRSYLRALATSPGYALRHWHRILYAFASLIGFKGTLDQVNQRSQRRRAAQAQQIMNSLPGINGWPVQR
jgi:hypothetical protein